MKDKKIPDKIIMKISGLKIAGDIEYIRDLLHEGGFTIEKIERCK